MEINVKNWKTYMEAQGYAPNTVMEYADYVREFAGFVKEKHDVETPADVTPNMAEEWLISHGAWSPATKQVHIIAIRAFFRYLLEKHVVAENPCGILHGVKSRRRINESEQAGKESKIYTSEQLIALIQYDDIHFKSQILRDKAIIALMASTGMRVSEVTWLNIGQIRNQVDNTIYALRKGQNIRKIFIADFAMKYINEYLKQRGSAGDDEPLFITRGGHRMHRNDIDYMLRQRQKALNLKTGTHNIRYTVLNSVERYADAVVARDIASHKSMSTTNGYMASSVDERADAIDALPWVKSLSK